jgi:ketosteroid isomerase-like protein
MDLSGNKQVVAELDALGNVGGDLTRLNMLCTPDIVNHALASTAPSGLEGTRRFLERAAREVNGARWLSSHVVAENDLVVQFGEREHHWSGGPFRGFDVPQGVYRRDTAFAYRLVDGRVAERWAIRDDLAMLLLLGAVSPSSR